MTQPRASGRNERLRRAMREAGVTHADLAKVCGRNVKTVQRWVYEGRVPYRLDIRRQVGEYLGVAASSLWPDPSGQSETRSAIVPPDIVRVYTDPRDIDRSLWTTLALNARQQITITGGTQPLLPDPGMHAVLQSRAAEGLPIRVCVGRGVEPFPLDGNAVSIGRTYVYQRVPSIWWVDNTMIVWAHHGGAWNSPSGPVLHLIRSEDHGLYDAYAASVEALCQLASGAAL